MPDLAYQKIREEIDSSTIEFWQRISKHVDERNRNVIQRPPPKIEIECATLEHKPKPKKLRPRTVFKEEETAGDFTLDTAIVDEELYDIVVDNPFAFRLVRMRIVNLGDALQTNSALYWGEQGGSSQPVTFTSGDFGGASDPNTYPTETFGLPAGGVFDMFCNQAVPALGFLQFNTGDFVDGGVVSSSLYAEFHYITTEEQIETILE